MDRPTTLMARVRKGYSGWWLGLGGLAMGWAAAAAMEAATIVGVFGLLEAMLSESQRMPVEALGMRIELELGTAFVGVLVLLALRLLLQTLASYVGAVVAGRYEVGARREMLDGWLDAPWATVASHPASEVYNVLTTTIFRIVRGLRALSRGLKSVTSLVVLVAAALAIGPVFVAVMTMTAAGLWLALRPVSVLAKRQSARIAAVNVTYGRAVEQIVRLADDVRIYGAQDAEKHRFDGLLSRYAEARRRALFFTTSAAVLYLNLAMLVIVLGTGALYFVDLEVISSMAIVALLFRALRYSQGLHHVYMVMRETEPFFDQLWDYQDRFTADVAPSSGEELEGIERLELTDVGFAYERSEVLVDLNLKIDKGQFLGLAGPSGSGKSTLAEILLGLRKPDRGQIRVNGRDADTWSRSSWYRHLAIVPQDPLLLDQSVADNVRFFRTVEPDAVRHAVAGAHVLDEVEAMPHGLDTAVGERGGNISGGQRQRLCIARALAGSPDLVVFDEPTSALDAHSEQAIHEALMALKGRVTVVMIAHRLSTLQLCDRLIVLDAGRVVADGPPEEVARTNDWYRSALQIQRSDARA